METTTLHIELLGGFRATYAGQLVAGLDTSRLQSLLTYVALHAGTPQSRQHVAFTFWPDSAEKQALTNLRQLLHHLRHALPGADRFIDADAKTLLWKSDAPCTLDVAAFEQALAQADHFDKQAAPDAVGQALDEAVNLYAGDLLPSCYDEWIAPERERLRQHYISALERLTNWMEGQRAYGEGLRYARLLQQKDPLRETTYRILMRLHALRHDRASALRVYHECATILERELSVAPAPATRELYDRLLNLATPANPTPIDAPPMVASEVPLVGRQTEWKQLRSLWHTVRQGHAHFVNIIGEAGIGKTRLAEELATWIGRQGGTTGSARCYGAEGRLAFAPVAEWLRSPSILKAVEGTAAVWRHEAARIVPELLIADPDLAPPQPLTDRWQRRRLFEALAHCVLAAPQPMMLLIDDLQWCDQDTLDWIHFLMRFDTATRLLVVATTRVEEMDTCDALETLLAALRRTDQMSEVAVGPLSVADTAQLAEHVAGHAWDPTHAAHLYRQTEGHPLFLVESLRADMADGGSETSSPDGHGTLPPKVHAVLSARLGQLSPAGREIAQVAAVVGRAFGFDIVSGASARDEDILVQGLDELWQRRIIREYGANAYDFSHGKLREVAYGEITPTRCRLLHRRAAETIEALYDGERDAYSAEIAAHYEHAGETDHAISYYQRAAEVAQCVHANEEAIRYLQRALSLLKTFASTPARAEREIELRVLLGACLVATRGWANPEVGSVYQRAYALCGPDTSPRRLLPVLFGLWTYRIVQAELVAPLRLGEELLELASRHEDPTFLAAAHLAKGYNLFHLGDLLRAREHFEQATQYSIDAPGFDVPLLGPDLGVFSLAYTGHVLFHLGYPDQALEQSHAARARADALAHPFSQAIAQAYTAMVYQFRHEPKAALKHAEATVDLGREYGFPYYEAWGTILCGWARAVQGASVDGQAEMQQGVNALFATGAKLRCPYHLSLLAEAAGAAGDVRDGMACLDEALSMANDGEERWQEAELHRLKGLLHLPHDEGEAERYFRRALDLATEQSARPQALRAAMSLHRLHPSQDAHALLKGLYDSFTEGFDIPDLVEARELLEVIV